MANLASVWGTPAFAHDMYKKVHRSDSDIKTYYDTVHSEAHKPVGYVRSVDVLGRTEWEEDDLP